MYIEFLLAQDEVTKQATSGLEQCVDVLKKTQKQKHEVRSRERTIPRLPARALRLVLGDGVPYLLL
jgi:hypothetical protein